MLITKGYIYTYIYYYFYYKYCCRYHLILYSKLYGTKFTLCVGHTNFKSYEITVYD